MSVSVPVDTIVANRRPARAVWKFGVPLPGPDLFTIDMPECAELLTVQVQHGEPQVWALVTPGNPIESRTFRIAGTGHPIAEHVEEYVGTFQMLSGSLIFHLFEVRP